MENNENPTERTCPACGSGFVPETAKQRYCNARCRRDHFEMRQQQQALLLAQQARQQKAELDRLKAGRATPVESDPAISPTWQLADLACQAQAALGDRLKQRLAKNDQDHRSLTQPGWGVWGGAVVGILLVLLGMALWYDHRRRQPQWLGMSFMAGSLGSLVLISVIGAGIGQWVSSELKSEAEKEQLAYELGENEQERDDLRKQLQGAEAYLEELLQARDKLPRFGPSAPPPWMKRPRRPPTQPDRVGFRVVSCQSGFKWAGERGWAVGV